MPTDLLEDVSFTNELLKLCTHFLFGFLGTAEMKRRCLLAPTNHPSFRSNCVQCSNITLLSVQTSRTVEQSQSLLSQYLILF